MKLDRVSFISRTYFLEFAFLFFVILFFLGLGTDNPNHIYWRMGYGFFVSALFLFFFRNELKHKELSRNLTLLFFASFILFQGIRSAWSLWQMLGRGLRASSTLPLTRYLESPLEWIFYFSCFVLSFFLFSRPSSARRLLWTFTFSSFFLALNAIPPLLIKGRAGYPLPEGGRVFFHPLFYFQEWMDKYLLGSFAHPNYTGDLIAFGFFAALGLFFYFIQQGKEQKNFERSIVVLVFFLMAANVVASISFLSRGTILCLAFAFWVYVGILFLKYPSRAMGLLILILVALGLGFLYGAINWSMVWKELQSIPQEFSSTQMTSLSTNAEAAKRALVIYKVYPLWGVGTGGYASVSDIFASPASEVLVTAKFRAMSHYLTLLAEEGIGAYLYFLFLLAYFFELGKGLWKVQGRFQFLASLSLGTTVLMLLSHASVFYLLQLFSFSSLLYILMGASLGILRQKSSFPKDLKSSFNHLS